MPNKKTNICVMLQRRENGLLQRKGYKQFWDVSTTIADRLLAHDNVIKTIPDIDDRSRSSYLAVTHHNGIAAMTHSNRCVSIIDTSTMKKIAEIDGLNRTVWTLSFHPNDTNLLATGDLGGTVCVFNKLTKFSTKTNDSYPVTSVSFHSREPLVFYSLDNKVVVWNYEKNRKVMDLCSSEENRVKYVKFNPYNDLLITGIRRDTKITTFGIYGDVSENNEPRLISCTTFLDRLLRSLSNIMDNLDSDSVVNLNHYWSHIEMNATSYYNDLKNCDTIKSKPIRFVGDFKMSLTLMKVRAHQIACMIFQSDTFSNSDILNENGEFIRPDPSNYIIRRLLEAIKYILEVHEEETKIFKYVEEFPLPILADILTTIQRILNVENLTNILKDAERPENYQYRLQAWNLANMQEIYLPDLAQCWRNLIMYCYIHNDSTVDISKCGKMIASFNVVNSKKTITVNSLEKSNLGEYICSYILDGDEVVMALSFSPSSHYIVVGIRSKDIFAYFFQILKQSIPYHFGPPDLGLARCLDENREYAKSSDLYYTVLRRISNPEILSFLTWSARPGDGILVGYKTYHIRCVVNKR